MCRQTVHKGKYLKWPVLSTLLSLQRKMWRSLSLTLSLYLYLSGCTVAGAVSQIKADWTFLKFPWQMLRIICKSWDKYMHQENATSNGRYEMPEWLWKWVIWSILKLLWSEDHSIHTDLMTFFYHWQLIVVAHLPISISDAKCQGKRKLNQSIKSMQNCHTDTVMPLELFHHIRISKHS